MHGCRQQQPATFNTRLPKQAAGARSTSQHLQWCPVAIHQTPADGNKILRLPTSARHTLDDLFEKGRWATAHAVHQRPRLVPFPEVRSKRRDHRKQAAPAAVHDWQQRLRRDTLRDTPPYDPPPSKEAYGTLYSASGAIRK
jgi:hypothetical protein